MNWLANNPLNQIMKAVAQNKANTEVQKQFQEREAKLIAELKAIKSGDLLRNMTQGAGCDPHITIGGQPATLYPLSPAGYATVTDELPMFVLALATKQVGGAVDVSVLEKVYDNAKKWLKGCAKMDSTGLAPTDAELERLSVPEASAAVIRISEMNGAQEVVRAFFRERTKLGTP